MYLNNCDISVKLLKQILKSVDNKIKIKQEVLEKYLKKYNHFNENTLTEICDIIFAEALYIYIYYYYIQN